MRHTRFLLLAVTGIAILAMLLPVAQSVNLFSSHSTFQAPAVYQADGNPFPPLPPKASTVVADGNPFPPLPPDGSTTLVADGNPFPPLPPGGSELVADGNPFPPLPPEGFGGRRQPVSPVTA